MVGRISPVSTLGHTFCTNSARISAFTGGAGAQGAADDADIAHIDVFQVDLCFTAGQGGDHDPACAVGKVGQASAHAGAAQAVDGHIHRVSLCQLLLQHCLQRFLCRIHNDIRAGGGNGCAFLLINDGGDHTGAERLGHRDHHAGQSAGTGLHQQGVARLQSALAEQIEVRRGKGLRHGGGLHHGAARRHRHQHIVLDIGIFGIAAATQQGTHPVAHLPVGFFGGCRTHLYDGAGDLQPHPVRTAGRRGIVPLPLHQVGAVERSGLNFYQAVLSAHGGIRYSIPPQGAVLIH